MSHEKKTATPVRADETVEWDVRNWAVALDYWRLHSSHDLSACLTLEIGSNRGGLSLWMARQGSRVICSDLNGPTREAEQLHREHQVSGLIEYEAIDATNIPYEGHFDIIFFKSVLGGVGVNDKKDRQVLAINQMHKALKEGGELFFAENLVGSPLHRLFRKRFVKWGIEWRYVSLQEMGEFLSPFSKVTYRTIGFLGAFGRNERQREVLSWFDKYLIDPFVPSSWRYIVAGVATK